MAIFKQLNGSRRYFDPSSRRNVINYITRSDKAKNGLIGQIHVDPIDPASSMDETAFRYNKTSGVQLRHFILSFYSHELVNPHLANEIASQVLLRIGQEYQAVYAVHEDTPLIHIHFMFNAISYVDGHRYYGTKQEYYALISFLKKLLHNYGIYTLLEISFRSGQDIQDILE